MVVLLSSVHENSRSSAFLPLCTIVCRASCLNTTQISAGFAVSVIHALRLMLLLLAGALMAADFALVVLHAAMHALPRPQEEASFDTNLVASRPLKSAFAAPHNVAESEQVQRRQSWSTRHRAFHPAHTTLSWIALGITVGLLCTAIGLLAGASLAQGVCQGVVFAPSVAQVAGGAVTADVVQPSSSSEVVVHEKLVAALDKPIGAVSGANRPAHVYVGAMCMRLRDHFGSELLVASTSVWVCLMYVARARRSVRLS
jgi:hypothetical protein